MGLVVKSFSYNQNTVDNSLNRSSLGIRPLENIDDNKVTHEYIYDQDIVNEVQPVTVKVHYQLFTFTNTYELLIVD